jgi:hypothetical protein
LGAIKSAPIARNTAGMAPDDPLPLAAERLDAANAAYECRARWISETMA